MDDGGARPRRTGNGSPLSASDSSKVSGSVNVSVLERGGTGVGAGLGILFSDTGGAGVTAAGSSSVWVRLRRFAWLKKSEVLGWYSGIRGELWRKCSNSGRVWGSAAADDADALLFDVVADAAEEVLAFVAGPGLSRLWAEPGRARAPLLLAPVRSPDAFIVAEADRARWKW